MAQPLKGRRQLDEAIAVERERAERPPEVRPHRGRDRQARQAGAVEVHLCKVSLREITKISVSL